ncbi:DEAD/DEAH box helicase family protein [Micromonospora zamorensis]|uniref:DEAD/DEAH box helicase family protein n=1 Tax=Micromonospora zamorensis TaxID=709883 RepID=UPI00379A373A
MTARMSVQALLAERLDRVRYERHIVLRAPAGSGVTQTLAEVIARTAAPGFVLVVSSRRDLLEQWVFVLERHGAAPVHLLKSDLALEVASRTPAEPHRGIFVTTMAEIRRGPVKVALKSLPLALLVLDTTPRPDSVTLAAILDVVRNARQTIVVDQDFGERVPAWLHRPSLVELTLNEAIAISGEPHVRPETYPVSLSPAERSIFEQVARLLEKRDGVRSRPAVHSALMRLISNGRETGRGDMDKIDMAWNLVDSLEGLGPDPRLLAMTETVLQRRRLGPVIVVTGPLRAEVEYVRDHLAAQGVPTEPLTLHELRKARAVKASGSPHPVIVATRTGLESDESVLEDATLVYFSRPRSNPDNTWLLSALHTGAARAAIIPIESQPGEAQET